MRASTFARNLCAAIGLLVAIAAGSTPAHAQEPAVSADQVVRLLEAGLSTTAVANEIRGRCLDFNVDAPGVEQRLRAAGADNQLLQQLRGFCYAGPAVAAGAGRPLEFGLFLGLANASIVDYEQTAPVEARRTPNFGVELAYQPGASGFGFQTGAIYVSKGEYVPRSVQNTEPYALQLNYVEVPLLARWAFALNGSSIRPVLLGGASLALNVGCSFDFDSDANLSDMDCDDAPQPPDVSTIDVGASIGVGVDVPVGGSWAVSPSIRYVRGLTGIVADQDGKNSAIQAGVTIRMGN